MNPFSRASYLTICIPSSVLEHNSISQLFIFPNSSVKPSKISYTNFFPSPPKNKQKKKKKSNKKKRNIKRKERREREIKCAEKTGT